MFTEMQLNSHSLSDRVPLGCAIFANFVSPSYAAQHPTRTCNPISDWDKRLLCQYKNSLPTDVCTKYTSYKNFSLIVTGLKELNIFGYVCFTLAQTCRLHSFQLRIKLGF